MNNLKIAFIPIARTTFDIPFAKEKADAARHALRGQHMDLVGPADLITDDQGVQQTIDELADITLDLVVLFQATFADSSMASALAAALDAPLFLWAVPESHTGQRLRLNSFCGINLAGHALTRSDTYYAFSFGSPDDPEILQKIATTASAGRARRALQQARLGRIGENPDGFETCHFRPDEIKKWFGLEIVQLELEKDLFPKIRAVPTAQTQPIQEKLSLQVANLDEMDPGAVHGTLSTYQVLTNLAEEKDLQGFAVRCWPEFFTELGCAACGAMSMLSDAMLPCSCEADVNGTITQLLLQSISGSQAFGTDMVSADTGLDALVLWHCGLAPLSMADPQAEKRVTIHSNRQLPLLMDFPLKPGRVTLARLSEAKGEYALAVGEGEILRAPKPFSGTSGLLKFDRPVMRVINTILDEGLEHHITLTYGGYKEELIAFANMLNIPLIHIS